MNMQPATSLTAFSLCLAALITMSRAQDNNLLAPTATPILTLSTTTPFAISATTPFLPSTAVNLTTSSVMPTSTNPAPPELFPPSSGADDDDDDNSPDRTESVFNYYFLFLAAFGALVAVLLWWLHRQRRRRKLQQRLSGQNALARDLEGWAGARRWIHGRYRPYQAAAHSRREEGLNEHGDAPPPYQPKSDVTSTTVLPPGTIAIPLRTLPREETLRVQPPEYSTR